MAQVIGELLIKYVKDSYQNDPFRVLLEVILLSISLKYLFSSSLKRNKDVLSEKEISSLIEEWAPEAIESKEELQQELDPSVVKVDLRGSNFLEHPESLKTRLQGVVEKYGTGTCGPRGFYGTIDLHQILEQQIAQYFGQESAVLYSQAFSAVSSTIPAFVKRDDIVFVDEAVNMAIQTGLRISRGTLYTFAHNDVRDLEARMQEVERILKGKKITAPRKFIVVEGLYLNTGAICPLLEIVELKEKYKCRLILDESYSLGTVSFEGGLPRYFGLSSAGVDITVGSFTNAVGSAGGFSCGSMQVSDHQRLSSQAFCFSASMPAILTQYTIDVLPTLTTDNPSVRQLNRIVDEFHKHLQVRAPLKLLSSKHSPIIAITAKEESSVKSLRQKILAKGIGANLVQVGDQKVLQFFLSSKQTPCSAKALAEAINQINL